MAAARIIKGRLLTVESTDDDRINHLSDSTARLLRLIQKPLRTPFLREALPVQDGDRSASFRQTKRRLIAQGSWGPTRLGFLSSSNVDFAEEEESRVRFDRAVAVFERIAASSATDEPLGFEVGLAIEFASRGKLLGEIFKSNRMKIAEQLRDRSVKEGFSSAVILDEWLRIMESDDDYSSSAFLFNDVDAIMRGQGDLEAKLHTVQVTSPTNHH